MLRQEVGEFEGPLLGFFVREEVAEQPCLNPAPLRLQAKRRHAMTVAPNLSSKQDGLADAAGGTGRSLLKDAHGLTSN